MKWLVKFGVNRKVKITREDGRRVCNVWAGHDRNSNASLISKAPEMQCLLESMLLHVGKDGTLLCHDGLVRKLEEARTLLEEERKPCQ